VKIAQLRCRLPIAHPALGGESRSREHFRAPGHPGLTKDEEPFEMETVGQFVKLTCAGHSRLVNIAQVLWADAAEDQAVKPAQQQQKQGGKR
jgi:hypothetical protein